MWKSRNSLVMRIVKRFLQKGETALDSVGHKPEVSGMGKKVLSHSGYVFGVDVSGVVQPLRFQR